MAINIIWEDEEETILHWHIEGQWNWEMLHEAAQETAEMRRKQDYRQAIALIFNLTRAAPLQTGELALESPVQVELVYPDDHVILVGRNAFTRKMQSVFRRMNVDLGNYVDTVESLPEAMYLIENN